MVKKVDTKMTKPIQDPNASPVKPPPKPPVPQESQPAAEVPAFHGNDELDLEEFTFLNPPKFPLGTTVPERMYRSITLHRLGISQFIEEAINSFDGNLPSLLSAAASLTHERRNARFDTGVRSICGRVSKNALIKAQSISDELKGVKGMSMAMIIGSLITLKLAHDKSG